MLTKRKVKNRITTLEKAMDCWEREDGIKAYKIMEYLLQQYNHLYNNYKHMNASIRLERVEGISYLKRIQMLEEKYKKYIRLER